MRSSILARIFRPDLAGDRPSQSEIGIVWVFLRYPALVFIAGFLVSYFVFEISAVWALATGLTFGLVTFSLQTVRILLR